MRIKIFIFLLICCISFSAKAQIDSLPSLSSLSLEELMNVRVISASGYLQKTSEAPSTIQVITASQIKDRGYIELADALRDVPGIDMIHINGYAPTLIYFRGMFGAENLRSLLMIDGIPENSIIGSNDFAGPAYSLHNVERIEIIWGPASALYGTNAFGGIINIITKKGGDMNGFYAAKGFGSFNTSVEEASIGFKGNKFEFAVSGSLYSTDGPKFRNRDPNYSASYVDKAFSLNGSLSYSTKNTKTTLGMRAYRTPMGWGTYANSPTVYLGLPSQGYQNNGTIGILARDVRGEKSGLEDSYKRTLFIQNEYKPGEKFKMLSRVFYRETGTGEDSYVYVTADGTKMIRLPVASSSNRIAGEWSANYSPNQKHWFSGGVDFYRDNVERGARRTTLDLNTLHFIDGRDTLLNINSTFLPRLYDIRSNFGSFLQYILNTDLLGKTNFTFGGRFDHNSYFGDAISPRLAIVNQPAEKLTFKLQFGHAFRAPTNLEIYQAPPNVKLKTEKILTYEANVIYALSNNVSIDINGFRNELRDVILIANLANLIINKNPGEIKINGIESRINFASQFNFNGYVNFTLQQAKTKNLITNRQRNTPGIARFKANAGASWTFENLFSFDLSGNWVGRRTSPSTSPYGSVDGYFLANCNITTKRLFDDRVTASLGIKNIFDTEWLDPGFRTADGLLYSTVLEQPGRSAMFKVAVNF